MVDDPVHERLCYGHDPSSCLACDALDSSYYTAKGSDRILFIPFTAFHGNFGGIDEILRPGEPYFTKGVEVEVTAPDAETRWLVLRLNVPQP